MRRLGLSPAVNRVRESAGMGSIPYLSTIS